MQPRSCHPQHRGPLSMAAGGPPAEAAAQVCSCVTGRKAVCLGVSTTLLHPFPPKWDLPSEASSPLGLEHSGHDCFPELFSL